MSKKQLTPIRIRRLYKITMCDIYESRKCVITVPNYGGTALVDENL